MCLKKAEFYYLATRPGKPKSFDKLVGEIRQAFIDRCTYINCDVNKNE